MQINDPGNPQIDIAPFDPKSQARKDFDCGVPQINNFLKLTAKKATGSDVIRVWVALDVNRRILGYYGICMHSVIADEMPEFPAKQALKNRSLPTAFISMIGVDLQMQGNGMGSALLADALCRIGRISNEIATFAVLLDVFDCGDPETVARRKIYYESFGFAALPDQPMRLFMPMQTVRMLSG